MTWGANSWGSEENPKRCSEALNKHACDGADQHEHWGYDPDL